MPQMFYDIYACLVVNYFSLPGLPNVIWCMCWLSFRQGQRNCKIGKVLFPGLNFASDLCMFGY